MARLLWFRHPFGQEWVRYNNKCQSVVRKLPLGQPSANNDLTFSYRQDVIWEWINFNDFPECSIRITKWWHDLDWAIMAKTPQVNRGQGAQSHRCWFEACREFSESFETFR